MASLQEIGKVNRRLMVANMQMEEFPLLESRLFAYI